ncbi:GNAT family N-acetyltransferase [bacterium]|nr:MAG: GNAT family N-acetyltransferase [bacterium]
MRSWASARPEGKAMLPVLRTERLTLRLVEPDEAEKVVRYLVRNREHLRPWEPRRRPEYYTLPMWRHTPQIERRQAHEGIGFRFRILVTGGDGEFAGVVALRDVAYGSLRSATLGYSMDAGQTGLGYAKEAIQAVLEFAFGELRLKRLQATVMPHNERSRRLLASLGFECEGVLRQFLEIEGIWRDHEIWSRLANP